MGRKKADGDIGGYGCRQPVGFSLAAVAGCGGGRASQKWLALYVFRRAQRSCTRRTYLLLFARLPKPKAHSRAPNSHCTRRNSSKTAYRDCSIPTNQQPAELRPMAKKAKPKAKKYIIQHGKLQHQTSARRFSVWQRAGLIVLIHSHMARVAEQARTVWEAGELFLKPVEQPGPSLRTNAKAVEETYWLAHAGRVPLKREQRLAFADWRQRFGLEEGERLEAEYLSREREFAVRAQYGW